MKFHSGRNKILIISAILLLVFSLNFFQKGTKNIFYFISSPLQRLFISARYELSDFSSALANLKNLKRDNQSLRSQNEQLLVENAQLKELRNENITLKDALNISLQNDFKLEFADVISKDPYQDFIMINKGASSNIKKSMSVLAPGKILLGKVSEVYDHFSKVMLISDKTNSFDAKLQGSDLYGIAQGSGNLKMVFDLIPLGKEVKVGDIVVTSALGGIYPKGILIGKISNLDKNDVKPHQKADLVPLFTLDNLESVFIITNF